MCISKRIKWIKKSHREKKIVECPREFIAYFNALETTCVLLVKGNNRQWLTPNQFEEIAGSKAKNYLFSIKCLGWPLMNYVESGELQLHQPNALYLVSHLAKKDPKVPKTASSPSNQPSSNGENEESSLEPLVIDFKNRKKNPYFKDARKVLREWLLQHLTNPYPSDSQKMQLACETGLTIAQVNTWFVNARRRKFKLDIDKSKSCGCNRGRGFAHGCARGCASAHGFKKGKTAPVELREHDSDSDSSIEWTINSL